MSLDNCVILGKPQPSHLASNGPREWSLASLIPLLNALRENVGSKVVFEGLIGVNPPRI